MYTRKSTAFVSFASFDYSRDVASRSRQAADSSRRGGDIMSLLRINKRRGVPGFSTIPRAVTTRLQLGLVCRTTGKSTQSKAIAPIGWQNASHW